jgi:hypothetical protein
MSRAKFMSIAIAALTIAGLSGGSSALAGNMVINGSFENSTPANGKAELETFNPDGSVLTKGAVIPNWMLDINASAKAFLVTGNNDSQNTGYLQVGVSPGGNFDGSNYLMVDSGPKYSTALYQTVDGLVKGQTYDISFYQASSQQINTHGATMDFWQVGLGDNLNLSKSNFQTSALMNNPSAGSTPWTLQHMQFTADTTGSEVLSFYAVGLSVAVGGNPNSQPPIAYLDGVTMNPVPEPSTVALTALGIIWVGAVHVRRRSTSAKA